LRVLVDHMGIRRLEDAPNWHATLDLAALPNVWIKASKFPQTSREPYPFRSAQGRFKQLFETFGPDRIAWGSNYPPSAGTCTYAQSVDFVRTECDFLSDADRSKIFAGSFRKAVGR
jgi:predicted TIM-barrel fold metal-dependent hydrolase